MADFSITRPEGITPAANTGDQDSARRESRRQRQPHPAPKPAAPEAPPESSEDDPNHQVDELA